MLVSAAVLEALPAGREHLAGVLYSGVGCGIALSGAVAAAATDAAWQAPWLLLGAMSAVLAVPAWWQARPAVRTTGVKRASAAGDGVSLGRLGAAYFLEGLGYIVSGTFAVAAVQRRPELAAWAPWVWVAAGLAAAPSAVLWSALARRTGPRNALVAGFGAQAIGMSLPVLSSSAGAAMAGALLFGGTFIGITTLTMSLGRALHPGREGRVVGTLTMIYGIGQALGPFLAGVLSRATGGPRRGGPRRFRGGGGRRGAPRQSITIEAIHCSAHPAGGMMPYVNIKITREGATTEQKAELIRGVTALLQSTLGKDPATTVVVIEEVDTESWGMGGESMAARRKRRS